MEEKTIGTYVWFGTCVRYLQDAGEGQRLHTLEGRAYILDNLNAFFGYLRELNLQVTLRASDDLWTLYRELENADANATLTAEQATKLAQTVTDLRRTLEAELRGAATYVLAPKRLDVTALMERVDRLFAPEVFAKLPPLARADFMEAGKCIALERATAAAFHVLRGTESVLRQFYAALVKRGRGSLMWGPIVADLRKKRVGATHSVVLNHLDHIRAAFRNPTAHPEKFYDIQEVQDLWSLCVDAVNRMAKVS